MPQLTPHKRLPAERLSMCQRLGWIQKDSSKHLVSLGKRLPFVRDP
jgi:hypothetical protein